MKRRLFKLALFLFLGAIVNVAVAWGCALWIDLSTASEDMYAESVIEPYVYKLWILSKFSQPGAAFFESQREANFDHAIKTKLQRPGEIVPAWTALKTVATKDIVVDEDKHIDGRGWPTLSLWCEYIELPPNLQFGIDYEHAVVGGIDTGLPPWGLGGGGGNLYPRALPLRPIWLGFAINTIFYAVILWLPFSPFQLRRHLRIKRGLCINCGYDLRGTEHEVCPECGSEFTANAKP